LQSLTGKSSEGQTFKHCPLRIGAWSGGFLRPEGTIVTAFSDLLQSMNLASWGF